MRVFKNIILIVLLFLSTTIRAEGSEQNMYLEFNDETEIIEIIEESIIEDVIDEFKIEINKFNPSGIILKEGIAGEEVLRVKRFFKEKGYININEDYYFDSRLKEVVLNYQLSHGIVADGIIGKNTYEKINEHMEFYNINIPHMSIWITEQVPEGSWIIINKSSNNLYYLNSKELINKFNIATGKSSLHTPEGKFSIVTKFINPSWGGAGIYRPIKGGAANNPLGKRWMGLNIGGGSTYGIHGNADISSIGHYASLGCIRMFNQDAEYLYELINMGIPVWIGDENRFKEYGITFKLEFPKEKEECVEVPVN